jgi:hypothetical protein
MPVVGRRGGSGSHGDLLSTGEAGADRSLRAVIIGCGRIAGGYNEDDERQPLTHVVAYRQAGVTVAGCCDRDAVRAQEFASRWGVEISGTNPDAVLERARPDLVSICTGPGERLEIVEQVIASTARALLIEKPLARTASEAARIHDRVRAWGRPALVNYLRAFDPSYQRLDREVRAGELGRLREIVGRYYGTAATNAAHLLERVLAMCGTPATARRLSGSREAPVFELTWPGGHDRPGDGPGRKHDEIVARFLPTDGCGWSPFELDLLFESSRVRVIDSEERTEWFAAVTHPRYPEFSTLRRDTRRDEAGPSVGPMNHVVCALLSASRGEAFDAGTLPRAVDVTRVLEEVGC